MKQPVLLSLFLVYLCACNSFAGNEKASSLHQYHLVNDWPNLPENFMLGDVTGVDVDTSGNIFIFHRATREWHSIMPKDFIIDKTIIEIDKNTGAIINSWGDSSFIMPHGLTVDYDNNIWVTDLGLQQVFKFSHDGKLLMKLGEARVSGDDSLHFDRPTSVAVEKDGSFYIADGYGNSRVMKFSAAGKFLFQWGKKGSANGEFQVPHDIALDNNENVYVADRENKRIQIFDSTGRFLKSLTDKAFGRMYSVAVDTINNTILATDYTSTITETKGSDIIVFDSSGTLLNRFGKSGEYNGPVCRYHNIALDKKGDIFVGDILENRVQEFKSHNGK